METVYNACPRDCYDTCSIVTTVDNGRIVKVEGNKKHPVTQGFLCAKVGRYATDFVYSGERIHYPMKRVGKKGEARFKRISWDEAYDIICEKIREVQTRHGYEKILQYGYFGHMGLLNRHYSQRFFNAINSSNISPTICSLAGRVALKYVYGNFTGMDPELMLSSKLVIFWGLNSAWSNVHGFALAKKAAKNVAKFVVIDPVETETAKIGKYLRIRPGTDGALAMGIANYLVSNDLYDKDFIENNTYGFDKFKEAVDRYNIDYVSEITGLQKNDIIELADDLSALRPNFIHIGFGLQKQMNGGEIVRTIALLPSLVGQYRVHYSNSDRDIDLAYLQGKRLASKPQRSLNMTQLGKIVANGEVSMLFVYGSNPLNTCPNQGLLKNGFERDDFFMVAHDLFLNDTACFADIVLPAASFFETFDVNLCYYHNYMAINNKAIQSIGESRSNYDAFNGLAKRFGFKDQWLYENEIDVIKDVMKRSRLIDFSFEELCEKGFMKMKAMPVDDIGTPSRKIEFYSQLAEKDGISPLPVYYKDSNGKYPIRLITVNHRLLTHSQNHNIINDRIKPIIEISREDADERDIKDREKVRLKNDLGELLMDAHISKSVPKGVALAYIGPWAILSDGKSINFLTTDSVQSYGGNSAYNSTFLEIEGG